MIEYALMVMILFTAGWLVIYGRGHVCFRAMIITGLIVASVGLLQRVERYRGTPRLADMPNEILVHGFVVDEEAGEIYLYCGGIPPESLVVVYEKPLHEALQKGRQQGRGNAFKVSKEGDGKGEGNGDGEGGEGDGEGDLSTRSEPSYRVELPRAVLPQK